MGWPRASRCDREQDCHVPPTAALGISRIGQRGCGVRPMKGATRQSGLDREVLSGVAIRRGRYDDTPDRYLAAVVPSRWT